ncbi:hypothetical protein H0H92_014892 [Tricholoma furcatifolium]|nr:hypothetical protein H0H92_014892 [Tricholoma furcatifolium]
MHSAQKNKTPPQHHIDTQSHTFADLQEYYDCDADDEYGVDDNFDDEALEEMLQIENMTCNLTQGSSQLTDDRHRILTHPQPASNIISSSTSDVPLEAHNHQSSTDATAETSGLPTLQEAAARSQQRPFFTSRHPISYDSDSSSDDSDGMDSQNEADFAPLRTPVETSSESAPKVWFKKPKGMPEWLYRYFGDTIGPMIMKKEASKLVPPTIFSNKQHSFPASFWVNPPEPSILLASHKFDPILFYRPRIFLWLPHFFVSELRCPKCGGVLEKNGALAPRRIVDVEDNFYLVSWAYYCRKGCKLSVHGWSHRLIESLPHYLRLAFPAILSHNGGLSHKVITLLRVGNQHKMGPGGLRLLLMEMHTLRFNKLQLQYLEAIFEIERGQQLKANAKQSRLDMHFG